MFIYFHSFIIKLVITHYDVRNTYIFEVALHRYSLIKNTFSDEVGNPIPV